MNGFSHVCKERSACGFLELVPQSTVYTFQIFNLVQNFKSCAGELGAPVQVDRAQALHARDGLHGLVRDHAALPYVESLQATQILADPAPAAVRYGAGGHGQGGEVGDTRGQVRHGGVGDPITEGYV